MLAPKGRELRVSSAVRNAHPGSVAFDPTQDSSLLNVLVQLAAEKLHALRVEVIKGTRPEIFITEELARIVGMEQRKLWSQNAAYNNSSKAPESCGPSRESVRRSATI